MAEAEIIYHGEMHLGKCAADATASVKNFIGRQLNQTNTAGHRKVKYWYVGQTDDLKNRLRWHLSDCAARGDAPWSEMHALYKTRDRGEAYDMENNLIKYLRNRRSGDEEAQERLLNAKGQQYFGVDKFYVYVLTDNNPDSSKASKNDKMKNGKKFEHCYKERGNSSRETCFNKVLQRFRKAIRVGKSAKNARYLYVGLTAYPNVRCSQHQYKMSTEYGGNYWERMHVLLETESLQRAIEMETDLIDFARHSAEIDRDWTFVHNTASGAVPRGKKGDYPRYFVYLLLDYGYHRMAEA